MRRKTTRRMEESPLEEYKDQIYEERIEFIPHKYMEDQEKQKEVQLRIDEEAKIVEQVEEVIEEITPPVEIETTTIDDTEEQLIVSFTVKGSKGKIKKLKEYIIELGLEWE